MSNFENEMKIKCLIIDIELKKDKNQHDYWVIRTRLDKDTRRDYLAFGGDYQMAPQTLQTLDNYPERLVNNWAVLTIKKNNDREKVIAIESER